MSTCSYILLQFFCDSALPVVSAHHRTHVRFEPTAAQTPKFLLTTLLVINPAPPSLLVVINTLRAVVVQVLLIGYLHTACPSASPKPAEREMNAPNEFRIAQQGLGRVELDARLPRQQLANQKANRPRTAHGALQILDKEPAHSDEFSDKAGSGHGQRDARCEGKSDQRPLAALR